MPDSWADEARPLNAEERLARQRFLVAHPGIDERTVSVTTAGYELVADWIAAGEPVA